MVILQFNKLIRNKWIWGAFAIAISAFFCLDDVITRDHEERQTGSAGTLAGEKVDAALFTTVADEMRGLGRNRDWSADASEINRRAWESLAALSIADLNGITATDDEVRSAIRHDPSFEANGAFSFRRYELILRENGLSPEAYEASLKRRLTLTRIARSVLGSAVWASPMELDQAIADMTDVFTVKVARFEQDQAAADAVALDDAGLRAWYEKNVKSLELPARVKIRSVKYDASAEAILAKMAITEQDVRDQYDATIDKYTSTDTNGVETVKSFDEVKGAIEKDLRRAAAVEYFETNLMTRAYAVKAAEGASRLAEIAKEDGLEIATSDWFSTEGGYQEGFMKRPYQILPGSRGLVEVVSELDNENEDLKYGIVLSDRAVWLVEKAEESAAHTPSFDEAKEAIRPRALRDAKAEAFKASVAAIAAEGVEAVLASGNVSTNLTFAVADLKGNDFPDQTAVARAVSKLKKGEVSEFTSTGTGRGLLVVCEDRVEGDQGKAMILRSQIQNDVTMLAANQIPASWQKWNLERLGFETTDLSTVEKITDEE